jgi:hypothetical protein
MRWLYRLGLFSWTSPDEAIFERRDHEPSAAPTRSRLWITLSKGEKTLQYHRPIVQAPDGPHNARLNRRGFIEHCSDGLCQPDSERHVHLCGTLPGRSAWSLAWSDAVPCGSPHSGGVLMRRLFQSASRATVSGTTWGIQGINH